MHQLFGGLKDALTSADAWKPFEPILRECVVAVGNRMWRERFIGCCMGGSEKWERALMHHFSGHKFDWRWEMLETLSSQLVARWPIMAKYANANILSKDGELDHQATSHLCRALANESDDLPGIELMMNAVSCITSAQGHNARWLRGCDCHSELLIANLEPKKLKQAFIDEGLDGGHCPLMGRRLVHLVHGGVAKMKDNIKHDTNHYNELLMKAQKEK